MAATNDADSALKTLEVSINQAPDVSRIYQESKELFKILEPFSALQLEHSKGQAVVPEMQKAVKGWCQLLNRSLEVAEGGMQFAEDTQFWMGCLSKPEKYNNDQLEEYIKSVRSEVKVTKEKVQAYNKSLHANRTEIIALESKLRQVKAELEQEKQGHQKVISDENEFVGKVAGTSIVFNVAAGIIMPASLFFTVPMALLTIGGVADKADTVIKSREQLVNMCDRSSEQMHSASEKFNALIQQTDGLVAWWEKVDQGLGKIERSVKSLRSDRLRNQAGRIAQAEETLGQLSEQFSNYSIGIRLLQDFYPPSLIEEAK